jgi:tRNA (guanine-N1)-methyltransferase
MRSRLLPGAIDAASTEQESFSHGLLEYPQYTRPAVFDGQAVPDVLVSGNHGAVDAWRHEQALGGPTHRPDLPPVSRPRTDAGLLYCATDPAGSALPTYARRGPAVRRSTRK